MKERANRISSGHVDEEYFSHLLKIGNELLTSLYLFDRGRAWGSITTQIRELFDCELVSLFWVDEEDPDYLVLEAQDPSRTPTEKRRVKIASEKGQGITGHAAKEAKTIILDQRDLKKNPYVKYQQPWYLESGHFYSVLFAPLKNRKGRLIGLLRLNNKDISDHSRRSTFTSTDKSTIELLAKEIVVLLENANAFETLRGLIQKVQQASSADEAVQCILSHAMKLLHADHAKLALWSQNTERLVLAGSMTLREASPGMAKEIPPDNVMSALWNASVKERSTKKEAGTDEEVWLDYGPNENCEYKRCHSDAASSISTVLRVHQQPIGVLHLESSRQDGFDELDRQVLKAIAQNVSIAVQSISKPWPTQDESNADQEVFSLGESEGLFQSLVGHIPHAMWRKDLEGKFTWVNDVFCEMVGKKRGDIIGRDDFDLFPHHLVQRFLVGDRKAIEEGIYEDPEEPFVLPSGETRYIHVIKKPIFDLLGNAVGTQGMFLLSAGTEIETALRDPDSRYLARIKDISFPVFCLGKELELTFANQAYLEKEGIESFDEIKGKTDLDLFPQTLGKKYYEDNRHVLKTGEVLDEVELHPGVDGRQILVRVLKFPIRDSNGDVIGVQGVFWDYEDQKEAKKELNDVLEDTREEYRLIVKQASEGILQSALDGRFIAVNPAMCQLLDCDSEEELLAWKDAGIKRFADDEYRKEYFQLLNDAKPAEPKKVSYKLRTIKDREIWVSESVHKQLDQHGGERLIGFVEDITERKRDAERLQTTLRELETTLREKEELLTMLSHQLRSPVWQAYDRADYLVHQLDPQGLLAEGRAQQPVPRLATIRGLARKARSVAWSIDMMSRLAQTGEVVISEKKVIPPRRLAKMAREAARDIQLIRRVSDSFSSRVGRKQNVPDFELDATDQLASGTYRILLGDPDLIEQSVANVIENAFKYSLPSSIIRIYFVLAYRSVTLTIQNRPLPGLEIDGETLHRCREQHWRSRGAAASDADGNGLGLWLVDRIMKAHQGELRIEETNKDGWNTFGLHFSLSRP